MGLSYPSYMWHRSRPVLAQTYRTIALDNRGVGQSDVPPRRLFHRIDGLGGSRRPRCRQDTERAGIRHFDGGMIAQEFALQYPKRVRSLI
jgi:pimeloyl-ACP methyl ester carboxylesterase